ncbi:MAG: hypothetical protein V8S89_02315 [Oscillospiraceae bacterium]
MIIRSSVSSTIATPAIWPVSPVMLFAHHPLAAASLRLTGVVLAPRRGNPPPGCACRNHAL